VERRLIGSDRILHPSTKAPFKSTREFLDQARRNANVLRGQPVLWFPSGKASSAGTVEGVKVVIGPASELIKQCRLRRAGWFSGSASLEDAKEGKERRPEHAQRR
ncbi:MAG: hypothetical protein U7M05_11645, partial [Candidatus Igneacidithiobacillus chanchocoensis]